MPSILSLSLGVLKNAKYKQLSVDSESFQSSSAESFSGLYDMCLVYLCEALVVVFFLWGGPIT